MSEFSKLRKKTVCFTGHRRMKEPSEEIEDRLTKTVEDLIQRGYLYFEAGGARGFDTLAAEVVLKLKATYPKIRLVLVLPFDRQYEHDKNWTEAEIGQYHRIKARASKVVVLAAEYKAGIYYQRNRYLVDTSSVCVAYLRRKNSGTAYTVNYAGGKGLEVVHVAQSAAPTESH